jgi:hypothetical protein
MHAGAVIPSTRALRCWLERMNSTVGTTTRICAGAPRNASV